MRNTVAKGLRKRAKLLENGGFGNWKQLYKAAKKEYKKQKSE